MGKISSEENNCSLQSAGRQAVQAPIEQFEWGYQFLSNMVI